MVADQGKCAARSQTLQTQECCKNTKTNVKEKCGRRKITKSKPEQKPATPQNKCERKMLQIRKKFKRLKQLKERCVAIHCPTEALHYETV